MKGSGFGRTAGYLLAVLVGLLGAGASQGDLQRQTEFGIELARKGLWQEAIFRWKRSLSINPYSAILHNNLAVAYETLGRYDEAAQEYERALELGRNRYEEIRENYENFMAFYSVYRERENRPEEKEQEQGG